MRLVRRIVLIVFSLAAVLYLGLCAALFTFQRSLIYAPQPRSNQADSTLMTFPVLSGTVNASTRPVAHADAVLYFGGNSEDVSEDMPPMAEAFPNKSIYLLHYPGYGGSSGTPSEKSIFAAALALFDRVHSDHANITVIGRSLGSGVAVWLASQRPVAYLVLVTPYDSIVDPAVQAYPIFPVRWLVLDKFDSYRYAPHVTAPTRIIVAENDEVIPRSSSDRLFTRFTPGVASYVLVQGYGHNDIGRSPEYWRLLSNE